MPEKEPGHLIREFNARRPNALSRNEVCGIGDGSKAEPEPPSLFLCDEGSLLDGLLGPPWCGKVAGRRGSSRPLAEEVLKLNRDAADFRAPGDRVFDERIVFVARKLTGQDEVCRLNRL